MAQTLKSVELPPLPGEQGKLHLGVAGAFAGVSHGVLLVAGGANFPNGYPWQGGTKVWHTTVYALVGRGRSSRWHKIQPLARPLAYGASAVWRERLIGLGGNDATRRYADVFSLDWDGGSGTLRTDSLPPLPLALANLAAAVAGDTLYAFGGESDRGTEKSLYVLSLLNPASGWQKRADLPGPARAFTALVAGPNASLYVLGGRQTVAGHTTVFADAYEYQITQGRWRALPPLPSPLAAHGAVASGPSILLVGGDEGSRLKQIEALTNQLATLPEGTKKTRLTDQRNALQRDHPGFSRQVWQYSIAKCTWALLGTLPFAVPVTTPVVGWVTGFVLPSGEVSPGVRTPAVRRFEPKIRH